MRENLPEKSEHIDPRPDNIPTIQDAVSIEPVQAGKESITLDGDIFTLYHNNFLNSHGETLVYLFKDEELTFRSIDIRTNSHGKYALCEMSDGKKHIIALQGKDGENLLSSKLVFRKAPQKQVFFVGYVHDIAIYYQKNIGIINKGGVPFKINGKFVTEIVGKNETGYILVKLEDGMPVQINIRQYPENIVGSGELARMEGETMARVQKALIPVAP